MGDVSELSSVVPLSYQVSAIRQELRRKQLPDVVVENYENLPGLCLVPQSLMHFGIFCVRVIHSFCSHAGGQEGP